MLVTRDYDSPLGRLRLVADARALKAILWPRERAGRVRLPARPVPATPGPHPVLDLARRALDAYFAGRARGGVTVPMDPEGTEFQRRVWAELARIPRGRTLSYRELAERVGSPRAWRGVGSANARNPISILVPCHRVIPADGRLAGFAGGKAAKAWLLGHEGALTS